MRSDRHTIIFDGTYFLFRTLFILPRRNKKVSFLEDKEDQEFFMRKLITDFSYQIRLFNGLINKVVWTQDSRSWRKDFFPEAEYKGNRKNDDKIDWKQFHRITSEFIELLEKNGVIISGVDGAEADDLIYAWNTESLAAGTPTIMFTGDRDLVQLVHKNDNNNTYSILFSPAHSKLYVHNGFTNWLESASVESADIFETLKSSTNGRARTKTLITDLILKKKVDIIEVDPEEFRFKKVLTGDAGDNVLPAYWYKTTKRMMGISDAKAEKIIHEFKEKHGKLSHTFLYNEELITDLANVIIRVMNAKHMTRERIIGNIKSNVALMVLSQESIPNGILDDMYKNVESKIEEKNINLKELRNSKTLISSIGYDKQTDAFVSNVFGSDKDSGDDFSFIKK